MIEILLLQCCCWCIVFAFAKWLHDINRKANLAHIESHQERQAETKIFTIIDNIHREENLPTYEDIEDSDLPSYESSTKNSQHDPSIDR